MTVLPRASQGITGISQCCLSWEKHNIHILSITNGCFLAVRRTLFLFCTPLIHFCDILSMPNIFKQSEKVMCLTQSFPCLEDAEHDRKTVSEVFTLIPTLSKRLSGIWSCLWHRKTTYYLAETKNMK